MQIFLKFIKEDKKFADIRVSAVYSDDLKVAKKLADLYGVKVMICVDLNQVIHAHILI